MIVILEQAKLDYWKGRLAKADLDSQNEPVNIQIIPDTLRWFIETIEYLQGKQ